MYPIGNIRQGPSVALSQMFPVGNMTMKITDSKSLGNAVREARRTLGVTQDQLALTSGTNRRFIIELERGKPTAQIGKVLQVLRTLGCSLELTVPRPPKDKDRANGPRA
jgi:HTH-type transcriptional regulator/antitoxin HipB